MSILLQLFKREGYRPSAISEHSLATKLQAAKEWVGDRWCLHPSYKFNPKHGVEAWKSK